jgi:Carboxypeptidase regulatory-like domain
MCEWLALKRSKPEVLMRRAIALVLLLSSGSALHAQSTFASLSGSVTDPSSAVILDATITVISADTNIRHVTTTNAAGEYYLANLPPRPYRIEVKKAGFKTLVKPGVVLQLRRTRRARRRPRIA